LVLSADESYRLEQWLGDRTGPHLAACRLIAARWQRKGRALRQFLVGHPNDETSDWLRPWCLGTLERRHAGAGGLAPRVATRVRDANDDRPFGETDLAADVDLYFAMSDDRPQTPDAVTLEFLLAYHRGDVERMSGQFHPGLARQLLGDAAADFRCCWYDG